MQQINPVQSSAPGTGNKLVSFLKTGYIVSTEMMNELFNFSRVDGRVFCHKSISLAKSGEIERLQIDLVPVSTGQQIETEKAPVHRWIQGVGKIKLVDICGKIHARNNGAGVIVQLANRYHLIEVKAASGQGAHKAGFSG